MLYVRGEQLMGIPMCLLGPMRFLRDWECLVPFTGIGKERE